MQIVYTSTVYFLLLFKSRAHHILRCYSSVLWFSLLLEAHLTGLYLQKQVPTAHYAHRVWFISWSWVNSEINCFLTAFEPYLVPDWDHLSVSPPHLTGSSIWSSAMLCSYLPKWIAQKHISVPFNLSLKKNKKHFALIQKERCCSELQISHFNFCACAKAE